MVDPTKPESPLRLEYASPRKPLSPPRAIFTSVVAILFAVCALGLGLLFSVGCVFAMASIFMETNSRGRAEAEDAAIRLLLCSVITVIPSIYYWRAALRELNRKA